MRFATISNTPNVLTRLHALASEIRGPASGLQAIELKRTLKASAVLLGMLAQTEADVFEKSSSSRRRQ